MSAALMLNIALRMEDEARAEKRIAYVVCK